MMEKEFLDKIGHYSGNKKLNTSNFEEPEADTERVREKWLGGQREIKIKRKLKRWQEKVSKTFNFNKLVVHMVGESHIDVAWMWTFEQTRKKAQRTFKKAILHSKMFPNSFHFALSEPILLEWIKEDDSELFKEIQEIVKKGNIELVGGSYVEPDCQMPSGEAMVRQRLHGMRFLRDNFGILPEIEWFLDSFGYNHGLPQILVNSGAKFFWTTKITWNRITTFPFVYFWWQGPDGTRILTANFHMGDQVFEDWEKYEVGRHLLKENGKKIWNYTMDYDTYKNHVDEHEICPHVGYFFGAGDGGHGPTHKEVATANELSKLPVFKWSTVKDFFTSIKLQAERFPMWNDELYLETHRGCFSNHAEVKRQNRKFENLLVSLEKLAVISTLENEDYQYPRKELEKLWKITLKNQFHDVLPGSSIPEVYDEVWEDWQEQDRNINELIAKISNMYEDNENLNDQEDVAYILLFNSLTWHRKARIFIPIHVFKKLPELNAEGKPPCAKIEILGQEKEFNYCQPVAKESMNLPDDLPAGWWTLLELNPLSIVIARITLVPQDESERIISQSPFDFTPDSLSNDHLFLKINPKTGALTEIKCKKIDVNKNLIKGDSSNLTFGYLDDVPTGYHAWNLKDEYWKYPLDLPNDKDVEIKINEKGPIFISITINRTLGMSPVTQKIILFKDKPEIFLEYLTDWKQKDAMLKILYSTTTNAENVIADGMFCAVQSSTQPKTPCDKARYEKICHEYFDLSTPDNSWGLALINEGKYAFDVDGGEFKLTLLRACKYPESAPEAWINVERELNKKHFNHDVPEYSGLGPFRCRYALFPHEGGSLKFPDGRPNIVVHRSAREFNNPVMVIPLHGTPKPPSEKKFLNTPMFEILNENVSLTALKFKEWEDDNSLIMRFHETCGILTRARIKFCSNLNQNIISIKATDLLEREIQSEFELNNETLSFNISPFQVRTFELILKRLN
ncbi:MAG: alpha-mannosidase [Promethearchaeota archaeon]